MKCIYCGDEVGQNECPSVQVCESCKRAGFDDCAMRWGNAKKIIYPDKYDVKKQTDGKDNL